MILTPSYMPLKNVMVLVCYEYRGYIAQVQMLSSKVPGSSFLENNDLKSDFICNSNPFKDHLFDLVPIEFAFSSFAYLLGPKID